MEKSPETKNTYFYNTKKFLVLVVIGVLVVAVIRIFFIAPFAIVQFSMMPTLDNGEKVLVNKLKYTFSAPERNDIIVFRSPDEQSTFFVKRIIGLPGEYVDIDVDTITIYNAENVDGYVFEPNFDYVPTAIRDEKVGLQLDENEYFVLGDNRPESDDSRAWGPLTRENIVGKVVGK